MIRWIVLFLATIIDLIFVVSVINGKKYESVVETLSDRPLYKFFTIGFNIANMKILTFNAPIISKLKAKTGLIYGTKFAEYYAYAAYAQALTYISLIMCFTLTVGAFLDASTLFFVVFIAIIICAAVWNFCILVINDTITTRSQVCSYEFPDMVVKFALLINSGMILRDAWFLLSQSKKNELYSLMQEACEKMNNGVSETTAIHQFGIKTNCQEIKKFTSSLIQGIEKGNGEITDFLMHQAQEMLQHKKQIMLQRGEQAAGKLILPIGLTFVGVILIIIAATMQSMSF